MLRRWPSLLPALLCLAPAAALYAGCSSSSNGSNTYGYEAGTGDDDGSVEDDGGAPVEAGDGLSNDISIITEPGDDAQGLLDAINAATTSIHMTMYILTDDDIQNALIAKKKAGLDVKVILNQTFPSPQPNSNADAYDAFHAVDPNMVTYAWDKFTFTHEKCVVIDSKTAWIMTMNTTLTSPTNNREFLAIDTNSGDVAEADAIFTADFAKTDYTPNGNLLVAPDNDKDRIRALVSGATTRLDVEVESFSDFDVLNDLNAVADNGVKVRVVLSDATASSGQNTCVKEMKQHKVQVVQTSKPYIHAKAIIADNTTMYVGSANLTQNSMENNRELGLITTKTDAITAVQTAINTDFAAGTAL